MVSYFACIGEVDNTDLDDLIETLNPYKTLNTKTIKTNKATFAVSYHDNAPLKGNKYYQDNEWTAVFAGDLLETQIPWKQIIQVIKNGNHDIFKEFDGYFSFTLMNEEENKIYIISDRRSQFPIFYLINDDGIYISTELSTFTRYPINVSFNIEWLWEYFFFNFPVGQTTFFENVKRMLPATVLEIDVESKECSSSIYAPKFRRKERLLEGREALEYAFQVVKSEISKGLIGADTVACALSAGWDTRMNLAFISNLTSPVLYTYGIPGCYDLVEASKIAHALDLKHHKFLFNESFEEELPQLAIDTIRLSSGLENVTRSTLLYAYRNLTDFGKRYPLVISGIFGGPLFRGHFQAFEWNSPDMVDIFLTGKKEINETFWKKTIGKDYVNFKNHILKILDKLEREYGDGELSKPQTILSYYLYECEPKYFAGEIAVAKHFTTVRVPCWYNNIIDLAHSIQNPTFTSIKSTLEDFVLQSFLIANNEGELKNFHVYGFPPKIVAKGNNFFNFILAHVHRIINLLPRKMKRTIIQRRWRAPRLENWEKWLSETLYEEVTRLAFSEDSRINDFLTQEYIQSMENRPNDNFFKKLITAEMILRQYF